MNGFHDVRFPLPIGFGAVGGPDRSNEIIALTSGREVRNQRRTRSRRRYDVGGAIKSLTAYEELMQFFEARRGSLYAFRFRDPFDWQSCPADQAPDPVDQTLGSGDGAATQFALLKTYGDTPYGYDRPVTRPVAGTVRVAVDGAEMVEGSGWTLDAATGTVTFDQPPAAGLAVTAGFEFDVPARFDIDHLAISLAAFEAGHAPSIPLVEVLE